MVYSHINFSLDSHEADMCIPHLQQIVMLGDGRMRIGELLGEFSAAQEVGEVDHLVATAQHVQMDIAVVLCIYYGRF